MDKIRKQAEKEAREIVRLAIKDHDDGGWQEAGLNEIIENRITTALLKREEKLKAVEAENKLLEKSAQARNGDKICFWVPRDEYIEMEDDVKSITSQLNIARDFIMGRKYDSGCCLYCERNYEEAKQALQKISEVGK